MIVLEASGADAPIVGALLSKMAEFAVERDEAQAIRIANAVGELFSGKG